MFPAMWKSPPCRNIDVNIVTTGGGKSEGHDPVNRHGTRPNSKTNASAGCSMPRVAGPIVSREDW
jgi:hypothetical protein